jgi:hypothetical protein
MGARGRKPGIESHPRRGEIEHDIAVGLPSRAIGRKYGLHKDMIIRWSKKIPEQLRAKRYVGLLKATDDLETLCSPIRPNSSEFGTDREVPWRVCARNNANANKSACDAGIFEAEERAVACLVAVPGSQAGGGGSVT